jgi:hypothetical protein
MGLQKRVHNEDPQGDLLRIGAFPNCVHTTPALFAIFGWERHRNNALSVGMSYMSIRRVINS